MTVIFFFLDLYICCVCAQTSLLSLVGVSHYHGNQCDGRHKPVQLELLGCPPQSGVSVQMLLFKEAKQLIRTDLRAAKQTQGLSFVRTTWFVVT